MYIPLAYVLEYNDNWEDEDDNDDKQFAGIEKEEQYEGLIISSVRNLKGERDYYKKLKQNKDELVIDLVREHFDN